MVLFQNLRTLVPAGRSNSTCQPVTLAVPLLRIVYWPSYPVDQDLVTWNDAVSVVSAWAVEAATTARLAASAQQPSNTAIDRFYERVLGDEQLAPYFAAVEMPRLKGHQVMLLTQVLGGPTAYEGRDLGSAHKGLGITDDHFGLVAAHLVDTLREAGVDDEIVGRVVGVLGGVKDQIVTVSDEVVRGA